MYAMTKPEQFDVAFDRPTDDQIDRLAQLMGSVAYLNLAAASGHMTIGGQTQAVAPHYCSFCRDNGDDGEGDCEHKQAMAAAVAAEIALDDELYGDHFQERADLCAMAGGR